MNGATSGVVVSLRFVRIVTTELSRCASAESAASAAWRVF